MRLYLVQHGEAKPEAKDPERSLTIRGEEETRKVSGATRRLNLRPSKIYHSGKKRVCGDEKAKAVMFRYNAEMLLASIDNWRF